MLGFSYTLYIFIVFPIWFIATIASILIERYMVGFMPIMFPISNCMIYATAIATIIAEIQIAKAWYIRQSKIADPTVFMGWFAAWEDPRVKQAIGTWICCMIISLIAPPAIVATVYTFLH